MSKIVIKSKSVKTERPVCNYCNRVITWKQFERGEAERYEYGGVLDIEPREGFQHTFNCEKAKFTRGHRPILNASPETKNG